MWRSLPSSLQVTPEFFVSLGSPDLQQVLLQQLVDALLYTKLASISALIKNIVTKVCLFAVCHFSDVSQGSFQIFQLQLSSELVVMELTRHLDQLGGDVTQTPRKRTRWDMVLCSDLVCKLHYWTHLCEGGSPRYCPPTMHLVVDYHCHGNGWPLSWSWFSRLVTSSLMLTSYHHSCSTCLAG